jgi:concanavalin A-like lectin/glucanase superfamily protein
MSYASTVLSETSLKAYYRMAEASGLIQDSKGSNHATAQTGTPVYHNPTGIDSDPSDYSLYMAGDYFSIPDHADLDHGDVLTVECWAAKDPGDANARAFSGRGSGALTWGLDSTLHLFAARADVSLLCTSTITVSPSTWYHFAYTKNGATNKLYINGDDVTGSVTDSTLADVNVPLIVGADYNGTLAWLGALDEVAFYSAALTQARIQAHYNAAFGQTLLPDADTADGGWTTTPLFSKVNDSSDATIITATSS